MARLNLIKVYNSAMCGVELLDSAVGTYRTTSRGKSGGSPILQIPLAFWWEQLAKFTVLSIQMLTNLSWLSLDLWFNLTFT